jgi:hypothetical protein
MINLIDINPESPFADMQRQYNERQKRWYSLTPEEQEAERKKFAAYDARIMAENDYDDEEYESPE